ncbi:putative transposase [Pseudidiomarina planktonica]|uniref:Putative transposase n=1 Tax=Pseudidiomarina planktonica TaxID=1323738 RepID=A0A1Y6EH07_9GAMM|nr:transposase [Pseudidiomarina planktonica]RUO65905.1 transposase [Pseudidiomarina planktonica]SMQ61908.1 putative transposase [Pseudidiomarina planktonica]
MTNVRRYYEGGVYFFTLCTYKRKRLLTRPDILRALKNAINTTRETNPFIIDALVIMPDHLHCVLTIADKDIPLRIAKIKALTTKALPEFSSKNYKSHYTTKSRSKKGIGSLWQKGYWEHTVRNEKELHMYLLYCCFNPVKHGYVKNALDWPHSTLRKGLANKKYPPTWRDINEKWLNGIFAEYDDF